jgi:3-oxoacyl-[acyl-carrier-protein] synthase-3
MSYLKAFGKYMPSRIVTNVELARQLAVEPDWILQVCGIEERRYAADDESIVDLGAAAARDCLARAGLAPESIGFLLVSSGSPDVFCPGPASAIATRLGLGQTPALDVPVASAGSVAALALADSLVPRFGNVLVVAAEIMSRRILRTPETKETSILFGDGAGACILSRDDGFARIADVALHSDGQRAENIVVRDGRFYMEGVAVIRQASSRLPSVIQEVLSAGRIDAGMIGVFLLHQANLKLLERVAKTLNVAPQLLFTNIQRYGNTSSASLLIAAAEWHERAGGCEAPLVLAGFGSGLTYGALLAVPAELT